MISLGFLAVGGGVRREVVLNLMPATRRAIVPPKNPTQVCSRCQRTQLTVVTELS